MKNKEAKLQLLFLGILIIIILIERFYGRSLFDASLPIIKSLQAQKTDFKTFVFDIFSKIGSGILYFLTFLFIFNWESRAQAFYHLTFLIGCLYLMNITKMLYHQPRPYFVDDQIDSLDKCSAEYGNPSGHSLFAAAYFTFIYLYYWHNHSKGGERVSSIYSQQEQRDNQYIIKRTLVFILCLGMFLTIGFSRLYLGAHSINQIIYGWQLGIWIAFYCHYCLRKPIIKHINILTCDTQIHRIRNEIQPPITLCIGISTGLFLMLFMSQIIAYIFVDMTFKPDPQWIQRVYKKCSNVSPDSGFALNDVSIIQASLSAIIYTAYLGILYFRRLHGHEWYGMLRTSLKVIILRFFIIGVLTLPFAILMLLTVKSGIQLSAIVTILTALFLCVGFVMFGVSQYFFKRFNLLSEAPLNNHDSEQTNSLLMTSINQNTGEQAKIN